jgi:MOSC domain-containing protein YiiM
MAKVKAVCTSEKTGTRKEPVAGGFLEQDFGLTGDAHADRNTHRQVSLLAIESINKMRVLGYNVNPGDFGENLTTEGIDLAALPVSTRLLVGNDGLLEITQIGKECHTGCAIFLQTGKCIMPKEGVFARVIAGGPVRPEDPVAVIG